MSPTAFRALVFVCLFFEAAHIALEIWFPVEELYPEFLPTYFNEMSSVAFLGLIGLSLLSLLLFFISSPGLYFFYTWARYLFTLSIAVGLLTLPIYPGPCAMTTLTVFLMNVTALLEGALVMAMWTEPLRHRFRGVDPNYL